MNALSSRKLPKRSHGDDQDLLRRVPGVGRMAEPAQREAVHRIRNRLDPGAPLLSPAAAPRTCAITSSPAPETVARPAGNTGVNEHLYRLRVACITR